MQPSDRRVQMGLAVQPFVAAALGFAFFPVHAASHGGRSTDLLGTAIVHAVFVGITATLITGCAAYPVLCWLLARGRVTLARTVLIGALLGNIPSAIALLGIAIGTVNRAGALPDPAILVGGVWRLTVLGSGCHGPAGDESLQVFALP